jgi:[acyl-carrier-protein] S-malonyltransferase
LLNETTYFQSWKKSHCSLPVSASKALGWGDLAEQFFVAADLFRQADEILGRKLSEIAWNGPIEELTKAPNCQTRALQNVVAR